MANSGLARGLGFLIAELVFATMLFFVLSLARKVSFNFITYSKFLVIVAAVFAAYIILAHQAGGFRQGFTLFGHAVTNIVNFILLFIAYVVGVGIAWLFSRLARKSFLSLKKRKAKSYWEGYDLGKEPEENYYRQF